MKAAQGRVPVFLDGGVRRGTDVFKALALGASGIFVSILVSGVSIVSDVCVNESMVNKLWFMFRLDVLWCIRWLLKEKLE